MHAVLPTLPCHDAWQLGRGRFAPGAVDAPRVVRAVRGKVPQVQLSRHYAVHSLVPAVWEADCCALSGNRMHITAGCVMDPKACDAPQSTVHV